MLKSIWLFSVRAYLRIGMFFYFRRTKIHGIQNIPKNKPVLILANHQNALLDALLIAVNLDRFAYFLTRAGVFKKSFVSKLLHSLNMLPVYRVRDGWSNLTNNNSIFEICSELLHQNKTVVIFPEGGHNLVRRVRPLSKGFTRIVFDTLEKYPKMDIQLVPIGLNFVDTTGFVDETAMYVGEPLSARSFVCEKRNDGVIKMKKAVHNALSNLTTNIPEDNYDEIVQKIQDLNVNYLIPKTANDCIKHNFENCVKRPYSRLNNLRKFFKVLLILNNLIPTLIWKYEIKPKIKELEFTATFRYAAAIVLAPFFLIVISAIVGMIFTSTIALYYFISSIILAIIAVKL